MKPENMKSVTRTRTSPDQQGDRDLKSDGMANGSSQGHVKNRFAGNQHGGAAEGNFGRAAANLVGNTGRTANEGPKQPPVSSVPAFEAAKKKLFDGSFNAGAQTRTPGGTRAWEPIAEGNFRGNSDRITEGRGPTKGNKQ